MHAKTDSEVTSLAPSSPPRSPRRPIYFVRSPSQPDAEKLSLGGSTPGESPLHHHRRYSSSAIHHSLESSTTRFSASIKNGSWRKIPQTHEHPGAGDDDEEEDYVDERRGPIFYAILFVLGFTFLFSLFALILWGTSKAYKPKISILSVVFESYNIQAGMDQTGVPTKMLSINSTVRISFQNPATFFGVHVSSTPIELYYYDLKIASGHMKEFYEDRKKGRTVTSTVAGAQVPLYGGGSGLSSRSESGQPAEAPVSLAFVVRSRAHVLGRLVRSNFICHVSCALVFRESRLGKPVQGAAVHDACSYWD